MEHGLDVVTVWVEHECAVVARVIVRANAGEKFCLLGVRHGVVLADRVCEIAAMIKDVRRW